MTPERLAKLTAEAAQTGQAVISKEEVAEIVTLFADRNEWLALKRDDPDRYAPLFTKWEATRVALAYKRPTPTGDA